MVSRREWLELSLAVAARLGAGVGLTLAGGCAVDEDIDPVSAATFEVTGDGALVAIRADRTATARVELETTRGPAVTDVALGAGGTGVVELTGLTPATRYRYRVIAGNDTTGWYELETAPHPDDPAALSFLFSADVDEHFASATAIFDSMIAHDAAFFISLGDWPYADNHPPAITLDDYRARHRVGRGLSRFGPFWRRFPVFAMYDDHEVVNNWDGGFTAREPQRVADALVAWDEYFPLRTPPGERFRQWRWGSLAHFFLLDVRVFRAANDAVDGPSKSMLGFDQLAWLRAGLRDSDAAFKLVITPVPLDFSVGRDSWVAFSYERDSLLALIAAENITGVVFLSADQHWFAAHHHDNGCKEFQVGPLARGIREPYAQQPRVVSRALVPNYGQVRIEPGPPPSLVFTAHDADGAPLYRETVHTGQGVLRVRSAVGDRPFVTNGAHRFVGRAPADFPNAPVGGYTIEFDDAVMGVGGTLADGAELTLTD